MDAQRSTPLLIAFVPVLHQGYLEFFSQHGGELGILGSDIIAKITPLTRDLRTLDPELMKRAIESLSVMQSVRILSADDLRALQGVDVTMPDDEISHHLAAAHQLRATFASYFLRWDKMPATANKIPEHHQATNVDELHRMFMRQAQAEARCSADWWRQVGAIVAGDGKTVFAGHNHHLPTDFHLMQNGDPRSNFNAGERIDISTAIHAEASLIARAACDGVSLKGSSMYVTTFPCPNCARLIAKSGIKRVYYAAGYSLLDAEDILKAHDVELIYVELTDTAH